MLFFTPLFKKFKNRGGDLDISNPNHWILQATGDKNSVSDQTALQISAVFACVRVIAETIASLPLIIYERDGDNRKPAPNHPLYPMLHDIGPNSWQTSAEFWENCIGTNVLRGNAYNYIVRDGAGRIVGLFPLNPNNVEVECDIKDFKNPEIIYKYSSRGIQTRIPSSDIWHLKGMSSDGIIGLSPLSLTRKAMNLSLSSESHGNTFFANGAKPSGVSTYPGKLSEPAYERLRASISERISGSNKFKVLLLEEGATWSQIGLSNEDSQFLETRQFQVEEIARFYRVPNILIGHPDKTSTYASAEQFMISFVTHTIRPWIVRIEKSILKNLMSEADQKKYYAEFKVDGLLRGDTKSRYESYALAIQNTWMSPNEARKYENMPPREGGDDYENPNITVKQSSIEDTEPRQNIYIDNHQPAVTVLPPDVKVDANTAPITVNVPAPEVNVELPTVNVSAPDVNINVQETRVKIHFDASGKVRKKVVLDSNNEIIEIVEE